MQTVFRFEFEFDSTDLMRCGRNWLGGGCLFISHVSTPCPKRGMLSLESCTRLLNPECGIVPQYTMPGKPSMNGVAEGRNRTLKDMGAKDGQVFVLPRGEAIKVKGRVEMRSTGSHMTWESACTFSQCEVEGVNEMSQNPLFLTLQAHILVIILHRIHPLLHHHPLSFIALYLFPSRPWRLLGWLSLGLLDRVGVFIVDDDINDVVLLCKLFDVVSFTHVMYLVKQARVRYVMQNPKSYMHSNIAGFMNLLEAPQAEDF
ncbi:hypothetical protein RJT34_23090 [Clitoria ternatea]|uniref:Uncharacterized protein n=1 Tax=Clitoria ternatea TaxID=43366 RepID=A0AAN9FKB2_CLITE